MAFQQTENDPRNRYAKGHFEPNEEMISLWLGR